MGREAACRATSLAGGEVMLLIVSPLMADLLTKITWTS
jgi:hypothetical protein